MSVSLRTIATSGTQSLSSVRAGGNCDIPARAVVAVYPMPLATCTRVDFTASFDGVVQPPAFPLQGNGATGSHSIAMASQRVPGVSLVVQTAACTACSIAFFPPTVGPPITPFAGSRVLGSSLTATVGADVTLIFSVTNNTASPVVMNFSSGQQYDFVIRASDTGALVWRWSADRGFTQAFGSRTLAPGETVTYTAKWTPPGKGTYTAQGALTSVSHTAQALAQFTVP